MPTEEVFLVYMQDGTKCHFTNNVFNINQVQQMSNLKLYTVEREDDFKLDIYNFSIVIVCDFFQKAREFGKFGRTFSSVLPETSEPSRRLSQLCG